MSDASETRSEPGTAAVPETESQAPDGEEESAAPGASGGAEPGEETDAASPEEMEGAPPGGAPPAEGGGSAAELDRLQSEFKALNDRHLRLAAEFENYRKRARGEMTETWSRAQADLVRRLLDSLDDLERVVEQDPEAVTAESVMEGVELVERKLRRALEEAGVEVLDPRGEPFDPETMEAMLRVPAEEPEQDETVAQVLQKGYVLKDHLVRPARVGVYKDE